MWWTWDREGIARTTAMHSSVHQPGWFQRIVGGEGAPILIAESNLIYGHIPSSNLLTFWWHTPQRGARQSRQIRKRNHRRTGEYPSETREYLKGSSNAPLLLIMRRTRTGYRHYTHSLFPARPIVGARNQTSRCLFEDNKKVFCDAPRFRLQIQGPCPHKGYHSLS